MTTETLSAERLETLAGEIKSWAGELGFDDCGIADTDLSQAEEHLEAWLGRGWHGTMDYMEHHGTKRTRPEELVPGTCRIISVRLDYLQDPPASHPDMREAIEEPARAYISRYTLGRDYHKVIRKRLQKLADRIEEAVGPFGYRAFVDSAPVMEKPLAEKAGIGWIGKHTNVLTTHSGSWFFLGELYTDLPLPTDEPATDHCGSCTACMDVCPTDAIVAPYQLDATKCISYLTIEHDGPIPTEFREAIGNRIFGCDDCQLFCPWNKFAQPTDEDDFQPRHGLDTAQLVGLFRMTKDEWQRITEGSALRRVGYAKWLHNLAIALGNSGEPGARLALEARRDHPDPLVTEAVEWALERMAGTV